MASLVAEHRLQSVGSVVVAHGLTGSAACGIFPEQGSNPTSPASAGRFLSTVPSGKSRIVFLTRPWFCYLEMAYKSFPPQFLALLSDRHPYFPLLALTSSGKDVRECVL